MRTLSGTEGRSRSFLLAALLAAVSLTITAAAEDEASTVPLRRVVMFTSGVGCFERLAEVDGNVSVDLKFKADDVNDLLQSMRGASPRWSLIAKSDRPARLCPNHPVSFICHPLFSDGLRGEGFFPPRELTWRL